MTKKIHYWKCLNCNKILNSKNVKQHQIGNIFGFPSFVMQCPYCNAIDNPFDENYIRKDKTKGFRWIKTVEED